MTPEQQRALAVARARMLAAQAGGEKPAPEIVERGMLLPLSKDSEGNVSFDSDSGILGSVKRAIMLPGQAMRGEIDPNSPEAIGRAFEFGLTFTGMNPAMRAGELAIPGVKNSLRAASVDPPTEEALKGAANAGFKAMRESGVDYRSTAVEELARRIKGGLDEEGFLAKHAPKTHGVLDDLANAPEGSVATISGLAAARKSFRQARKDFNNPSEQEAARRAVGGLDEFISNPGAESILSGSADEAAKLLKDANANYAASKRVGAIGNKQEIAKLRADASNSGQNIGNSIRQRIVDLITRPKEAAGYSEAELKALKRVSEGSTAANATRYASNLLGGGGGLGASVTAGLGAVAGSATGSPALIAAGAGLPILGAGLRAASNRITNKALDEAMQLTASRSPLYERMLQEAPFEADSPNRTVAALRALILGVQQRDR